MNTYDNTNRGVLYINDKKREDKHPALRGKINVEGKDYWISVWSKENEKGKYFPIAIELVQQPINNTNNDALPF